MDLPRDVLWAILDRTDASTRRQVGLACKKMRTIARDFFKIVHLPRDLSSLAFKTFLENFPKHVVQITATDLSCHEIAHLIETLLAKNVLNKLEFIALRGLYGGLKMEVKLGQTLAKLPVLKVVKIHDSTVTGICIAQLSIVSALFDQCHEIRTLEIPTTLVHLDISNSGRLNSITPLDCLQLLRCENCNLRSSENFRGERYSFSDLVEIDRLPSLYARGADLYAQDHYRITPLIRAAAQDKQNVATFLLDRGVKPDFTFDPEWTALDTSLDRGHRGMFQLLLDRGASPNGSGNLMTPLGRAAGGDVWFTQELLRRGADPHRKFNASWCPSTTALHRMALYGNFTAATLLLDRGVDPSVQNKQGFNAAQLSAHRRRWNMLDLLFKRSMNRFVAIFCYSLVRSLNFGADMTVKVLSKITRRRVVVVAAAIGISLLVLGKLKKLK